ncbi:hypothetical protein P9112_009702 [Eukaryota sp. TZLM1-RC]
MSSNQTLHVARAKAREHNRLLSLVFYSTIHSQYDHFVKNVLPLMNQLSDRYEFWLAKVNCRNNPEIGENITKYNVASFPFCVVADPSTMKSLDRIPLSTIKPNQIVAKLRTVSNAMQQDMRERNMATRGEQPERSLRREQEQAFAEAELAAKKRQEEQRKEAEDKLKEEQAMKESEERRKERGERARAMKTEIPKEEGETCLIGVRLPDGSRIEVNVPVSYPVSFIFDWITLETSIDPDRIILVSNFPKEEICDSQETLENVKITGKRLFFVEYKS